MTVKTVKQSWGNKKHTFTQHVIRQYLLRGEGQIHVFLCAHDCRDVLPLVIKLVVAVLSASD